MFWLANIWNRYSLPMRLAGSPEHVSSAPNTAKLTPALTKIDAMARVTSTPRSTRDPEHPTQKSTSASGFSAMVGTSAIPSRHDSRVSVVPDHGCPRCSIDCMAAIAVSGADASSSTRYRRISTIESMCRISTGHASTHAAQVVHDHNTSSPTASRGIDVLGGGASAPTDLAPSSSRLRDSV